MTLPEEARRALQEGLGEVVGSEVAAGVVGEIVDLSGRTEVLGRRMSDLSDRMDSMQTELRARFDAVDARFDAVDAKFDAIVARFDAVDDRFAGVYGRLDSMDGRLAGLSEQRTFMIAIVVMIATIAALVVASTMLALS